MLDVDLTTLNVQKTHALVERLETLSDQDPEVIGRLSADLGDLYAGATRYQRLIDAILAVPNTDREQLGELLSDLYEEMRHLGSHLESSLGQVDALAERYDLLISAPLSTRIDRPDQEGHEAETFRKQRGDQ